MLLIWSWLFACTPPGADPDEGLSAHTGTADSLDTAVEVVPATGPVVSNVVLISIDTTRRDHLSPYGYSRETTPRLAEWAEGATVFERAFSHAPWTKPSMTSVFTSQLPDAHGVIEWDQILPETVPTLPKHVQAAGLRTHAVVAHNAFISSSNNFHLGFDVFDTSMWEGIGSPSDMTTAVAVADNAIAALEDLEDPFFLWVHFFDPHNTYLEQPEHVFGTEAMDRYDGEIAHTDAQLGRLLDALDARPDTAVILIADHGEEFGDHGGSLHTNTLYNELVRVPLLIKLPGATPKRVPDTVGLMSLAPTILSWLDLPAEPTFTGESLLFDGTSIHATEQVVFTETERSADLRGIVLWPHKLVHDRADDSYLLFDLVADPDEQTNLESQETDIFSALRAQLLATYPL